MLFSIGVLGYKCDIIFDTDGGLDLFGSYT